MSPPAAQAAGCDSSRLYPHGPAGPPPLWHKSEEALMSALTLPAGSPALFARTSAGSHRQSGL